LCGNSNGDPKDDDLMVDGTVAQNTMQMVQSWRVTKQGGQCVESCAGDCRSCHQDQVVKYKEETSCGLLTQPLGPFKSCHATIDPTTYLKICVHDLCMTNGDHRTLCQVLQAYGDTCQEEGVNVSDWRTPARCPLSCPEHSNYTPCGTSSPTTCNPTVVTPTWSPSTCVETCECHQGFVFDGNRCLPQSECGCTFKGLLHGLHEEFWGDTTCTKRCVCDGTTQRATCRWAKCREGEECRVEEGIQSCYPKSYGTCTAVGATHYETFDGGRFIFQGTCVYQLVGLCQKKQDLEDFQVLVQNSLQEEDLLSSIALVMVKVSSQTVVINQEHPGKVTIDDRLVNLPYHHPDGKFFIYRGGQEAVVETNFGVTITYDWKSQVTVTVASTYAKVLCGLCGNYNGEVGDEMMMKTGQVTSNPDTFGHSWKVSDTPGCLELSTLECPTTATTSHLQKVMKARCGVILEEDGPFGACHGLVDPRKFFQSCVHDFCLFPDREDLMCSIIARYATTCQAAGVTIRRWRREDFCNLPCPANSHYDICSRGCPQTCGPLSTTVKCSAQCREGCVCDQGFVLSGDECVPRAQCGCTHHGFYHKVGETFYPTKEEKCHCQPGGTMSCQASCPEDREGKVIDGVFQCLPPRLGTCMVMGDRTYISFDGMAFNISGTCSYILAETCDVEVVQPFVVTLVKDARQKKKVSGIQAVSIEVHGLMLTLKRGKRGAVMVNSISHHLPAFLSNGRVQVHQHGLGILLQTNFGLLVHYDLLHHVTVAVPQSYQGHLCGLCGNYNGRRDDELLLSGQQAPDVMSFSLAWRTSRGPCSDDCPKEDCPVCSEEKKVVLQKRSYCGFLLLPKGPLASCHHLIDPTPYFQACLHDLCLTDGDTRVLCQSIQSYATACQHAGVTIKAWRRPSFCPLRCPANSSYSLCTNHCSKSCAGLVDPSSCPKTCLEGCECDDGFVFDLYHCVPRDKCGCFADGQYYKPHEVVLKDKCQQRCTCVPGQGLVCSGHSCTDDETCETRDGILSC
ncbi:FCGBP protein, partial [Centropus unirufus]|nr:FCGBP protein [Centropus unirufus]